VRPTSGSWWSGVPDHRRSDRRRSVEQSVFVGFGEERFDFKAQGLVFAALAREEGRALAGPSAPAR
jgi:hypothetical protein